MRSRQQTRSRQSAQNITDSPQRLGQSSRFSCLRGGDAGQSLRKDLAWTVPIATAKATSLHLDLHRLPLPGQIAQAANIGAVIRNFRSRTARTSRPSPTSNPENNIPFDLLHGVQYQQLWLGQRPLHNINGLAHNPNIANSSSLHRKCARTYLSATRNRCPVFKYTEFTSNGVRPVFKCSSTGGLQSSELFSPAL